MIYRAISAVPDPSVLPNVEFTLDRMDHPNPSPQKPGRVAWGWTRHVTEDNNTWVMPDFNGWASSFWDTVGGYRAFRERSKKYLTPFEDKTKKALWRGQINVGQKVSEIRKSLLEASKDKSWSDIEEIRWDSGLGHPVQMEEHCKWQFLIHTEGNSWSGRLRNLVNCNSAIIIHNPLNWTAHFYSVLEPDGPNQVRSAQILPRVCKTLLIIPTPAELHRCQERLVRPRREDDLLPRAPGRSGAHRRGDRTDSPQPLYDAGGGGVLHPAHDLRVGQGAAVPAEAVQAGEERQGRDGGQDEGLQLGAVRVPEPGQVRHPGAPGRLLLQVEPD